MHLSGAMFQCLCLYFRHPISLSPFSPFPMISTTSEGVLVGFWRFLLLRLLPLSSPSSSSTQALSTVSMKLKSCCTLGSRNSEASRLSPKCTVLLRRRRSALDTTWKERRPYRGRVEDDSTIAPHRCHQSMFLMLQCKAHSVFILVFSSENELEGTLQNIISMLGYLLYPKLKQDGSSALQQHVKVSSKSATTEDLASTIFKTRQQKWPPTPERQTL